ncbi:MAG: alpha-L-arabinofuranosidase C-terminal domain-containing protein [Myxococcota bacterium]
MSPTLFGLFLEDINFACDGGLNANLVNNYSFDAAYGEARGLAAFGERRPCRRIFDRTRHWTMAGGALESCCDEPVVPDAWFGRIRSEGRGVLSNPGYPGDRPAMPVGVDEVLLFSALLRSGSFAGRIEVRLVDERGRVLARGSLESPTSEWASRSVRLRPIASGTASLELVFDGVGTVDVDEVRLVSADHWGAGDPRWSQGVLRRDLVEALRELAPRFMRFPGGCIVEGASEDNAYDWKKTIGPLVRRGVDYNLWCDFRPDGDYSQSFQVGFYEYFLLCEDLGMKPMPVLNAGLGCQMRFDHVVDLDGDDLRGVVQSALHLIDWATGDPSTNAWAALRAEAGHPDPFELEILAIGNENFGPAYFERFERIREAVRAHRPGLTVILSAGPFPEGEAFESSWARARALGPDAVVDEHFYQKPAWLIDQACRYDRYDRRGPRVFLGEYAAHPPHLLGMGALDHEPNTFASALAEAAFLTGVERNADVVAFTSYAPLLCRIGAAQWMHNLIEFTPTEVIRTPNHHVQRLFSTTVGERIVPVDGSLPANVHASCTATRSACSIKLVNVGDRPVASRIEVPEACGESAAVTVLTADPGARNGRDEAGRAEIHVQPTTFEAPIEGETIALDLPAHSLVVLDVKHAAHLPD